MCSLTKRMNIEKNGQEIFNNMIKKIKKSEENTKNMQVEHVTNH